MSSLPFTLSLISLPLFWLVLARFGNKTSFAKRNWLLSRLSIVGSLTLLALLLAIFWVQPPLTGELLFKLTPINTAVITVVVLIGGVIVRYSRNYMTGEACYPAFFRWMKLTLAAVVVTLMANHLAVFWLGWLCVSLSLHRLLVLYPDRPRAVLGAHKKFFVARLSETLMLAGFALLYWVFQTPYIDDLLVSLAQIDTLPQQQRQLVEAAAILLASAAILKCAQLPFHGWLINVVEAPTPVSALLHAGVINLGGYLLLAFAPLIALFPSAQWLILVCAGLSTIFAALIMSTRVSVKVRLAWSTSSQMGLMLIECALGLYALALVHLVAHALYKAFAFLNSGSAVSEQVASSIAGMELPRGKMLLASALVTALGAGAAIWLIDWQSPIAPWVLLTLSLVSLLAIGTVQPSRSALMSAITVTLGLAASYVIAKTLAGTYLVEELPAPVAGLSAMDLWISALFVLLFAVSWLLKLQAHRSWVQKLKQTLFAGLYLDEWFTRATLKLWPVYLRESTPTNAAKASVTTIGSR
ncbi:NADH-quinone oxidoreductase subunit L [Microbulbifer salipaludis]|uniref:Probable inorganic carbon transporter subunit DabB n=1 Tax=Microbulbifer salipaludis TaxID=187980 RepID=A0ABS3E801_9GAMM|nr:NADH-quinone oxidoreductase subunit L [Microbulbifer salipaludis]MBN8431431.1 NADH-quinone oxidoreductase subunit L [Microbulbifer salipaludis]